MLTTLLTVYILGGLTFFPVVVALLLAYAWLTAEPIHQEYTVSQVETNASQLIDDIASAEKEKEKERDKVTETKISLTLLVRRGSFYPLPPSDANRSFTFLPGVSSSSNAEANKKRNGETLFLTLKGETLYFYTDEKSTELVDVLALGQGWEVEIYHPDYEASKSDKKEEYMMEGELFAKRNCVRLWNTNPSVSSSVESLPAVGTNPQLLPNNNNYYFFPTFLPQMETLYHALLHTLHPELQSSVTSVFSRQDLETFIAHLDLTSDPLPTRWLNALLARVFFSYYKTSHLENFIKKKLNRKFSRIKKPSWLSRLEATSVDVGTTPPMIHRPILKNLSKEGEAAIELVFSYEGTFRITVGATATFSFSLPPVMGLNLGGGKGKPSQPRNYEVDLVLAVTVHKVEGNVQVVVKPPPSNRFWYGFTSPPELSLSVEPIVSDRALKWSMVLGWVEGKLKETILESLVLPNMDDVPFFSTEPLAPSAKQTTDKEVSEEKATESLRRAGIWGSSARAEPVMSGDKINPEVAKAVLDAFGTGDGEGQVLTIPGGLSSEGLSRTPTPTKDSGSTPRRRTWFSSMGRRSSVDNSSTTSLPSFSTTPTPPETVVGAEPTPPSIESAQPIPSKEEDPQTEHEDASRNKAVSPAPPQPDSLDAESASRERALSTSSNASAASSRSTSSSLPSLSGVTTPELGSGPPSPIAVDKRTAENTKINSGGATSFFARATKGINLKELKDLRERVASGEINKEMLSAQAMGVVKKWGWRGREVNNNNGTGAPNSRTNSGEGGGAKSEEEDTVDGAGNEIVRPTSAAGRESYSALRERVRERTASSPVRAPAIDGVSSFANGRSGSQQRELDTPQRQERERGRSVSPSPAPASSSTSLINSGISTPLYRSQPSVNQIPRMTIPGIHSSHRGAVMSISSTDVSGENASTTSTPIPSANAPSSEECDKSNIKPLPAPPPLPPRRSSGNMSSTSSSVSSSGTASLDIGKSSLPPISVEGENEAQEHNSEEGEGVKVPSPPASAAQEALKELTERDLKRRSMEVNS